MSNQDKALLFVFAFAYGAGFVTLLICKVLDVLKKGGT